MRYKKVKKILLFICIFVSIGAFYGSICMFIDPSGKLLGMNNLLPYFEVLPFSNILFNNYIFSGISLLIVNGLSNLIASLLIIKDNKKGLILGSIFGFTLILWIIIQFIILPKNALSISFFIIGIIQLIVGYMAYVFYTQEHFVFNKNEYKNINKNNDNLVVYFSRMGYTRKVAYEKANDLGACIVELKTNEKTDGTLGFWWCGRYGMHRWKMQITNKLDLKKYKKIIIVSPIWVFDICAPIRDFVYKYKNDIDDVQYIFTHFMNVPFLRVKKELDDILELNGTKLTSICVRLGKVKKSKTY